MSLRTRTLLLFLAFVLLPLGAVGVVATLGTRTAVETALMRQAEMAADPTTSVTGLDRTGTATAEESQADRVDEILAPLNRVWVIYVAFMLSVGAAATLGFRLVTRRLFHALEEVSGAVEQMAAGDFAPWLPPPGQDEVGWLSLALGRMAKRIDTMMQKIEQSSRLAMVGEMAAQLAHEVRNPLSSIKMNLQILERSATPENLPPHARSTIETSLSEIARLESAVRRMLEFGAPERGLRSRCQLHEVLTEAADLLRSAFTKQNIALRLDLAAESDWIWADRGRAKGVFLNLFVNARDAMPDGGELLVETQLFLGEGGRQMVAVAVSDSGSGVPPALREEIFHPFFTTKPEGSGIGLPAALRTLREHGGDLYLSQRPDGAGGACFVALFALVQPESGDLPTANVPDPIGQASIGSWRRMSGESTGRRSPGRTRPPADTNGGPSSKDPPYALSARRAPSRTGTGLLY